MPKVWIICILFLSFHFVEAQNKPKKTVFIIVDGIPADVVEKVNTPYLDQIAKVGGYTRAIMGGEKDGYSQTPTISAVGYNSLLTGTWANKHNVWGNGIEDPNYNYWTIFRYLEEQYPEKKTAIFSTWLDNRTKLVGEGLPETGNIQLDYHFDGFELDTIQFPHDADRKYIHNIDEHVVKEATRYIKENGPDLSWVYLEFTDDMGHKFGDSPQMYDAVEVADDQIGKIWNSIQHREQNHNEDWLIVITTDHGRDAETGKGHGGQSERERTIWITTNAADLNARFKSHQPAMVDILPTITRFMDISIPEKQTRELDGVPLTGPVSISNPAALLQDNKIKVTWKAQEPSGKVKIWLSKTNKLKEKGKADKYKLLGEANLQDEQFSADVGKEASSLYKIVLEAPHNTVNRWILVENGQ